MELKIIYEHEEMRDMVVRVNSDGMQKIMQILMDDNNIIVTQLTPRAPDVMPCGHPLAEAYDGEDGGTYCRICESA